MKHNKVNCNKIKYASVCLCISKMHNNTDMMGGRKGLEIFCYKLHYGIVLFESGLELVVNVFYKP